MSSSGLNILSINLQSDIARLAQDGLQAACFTNVQSLAQFEEQYEEWKESSFQVILCGLGWSEMSAHEIAQSLRMKFRLTPILFAAPDSQVQSREQLLKNGFGDLFYLPMDKHDFESRLRVLERQLTGLTREALIPVSTLDLDPDCRLEFAVNLYLPMNRKYVKLTEAGGKLSHEQVSRLKANSISKVYIPEDQVTGYRNYLSTRLKDMAQDPAQRETLGQSVREFFQDMLAPSLVDLEGGRRYMGRASQLVAALVPTPAAHNLHEEFLRQMGDAHMGLYKRSQRVAAMAGLIALGVGHCQVEDVVFAALFCDIGSTSLNEELHTKLPSEMTESEKELCAGHIHASLQVLAEKKMSIVPAVRAAIQQHHERADGSGYPNGLKEHRLAREAQILSAASQIEELTSVRPGRPRLGPGEATSRIAQNGSIGSQLAGELKQLIGK